MKSCICWKIMTAYQRALINGLHIGRSCFCFWLVKRYELNMLFVNVNINNIFLLKFCFMFFQSWCVAVIVWIHLWHWAREIVSPLLQKLTFHFGRCHFHQQGRLLFKACLSCRNEMAHHLIFKKALLEWIWMMVGLAARQDHLIKLRLHTPVGAVHCKSYISSISICLNTKYIVCHCGGW